MRSIHLLWLNLTNFKSLIQFVLANLNTEFETKLGLLTASESERDRDTSYDVLDVEDRDDKL